SGLTILVGPNNSGKTTVVNALRLLLSPGQVDLEQRHEGHALIISITNDLNENKSISNPDFGAIVVTSGAPNTYPTMHEFRFVPARRAWSPYTGMQTIDPSQYWAQYFHNTGEDAALVARVARFDVTQRNTFDALLKELIPQINKWRVELSRGQSFILY